MRATLNFNLPDDEKDFAYALSGRDALLTLWDIDAHCRSVLRHQDPTPEVRAAIERVRGMIPEKFMEMTSAVS